MKETALAMINLSPPGTCTRRWRCVCNSGQLPDPTTMSQGRKNDEFS